MGYYVTFNYESQAGSIDERKLKELNEALERGDFPSLQGATVEWDGDYLSIEMGDYLINYNKEEIEKFCRMLSQVIKEGSFYITFPEDQKGYVVAPGKVKRTILIPVPEDMVEQVYQAIDDNLNL